MKTSPFGPNRAEQFDDLVEGRISDAPEELIRLLEFAEGVWALPAPEPRPEFTASLRERLMAEAPTAMAAGATDHRLTIAPILSAGSARRRRRAAAAVAVLALGGTATGTAFAADDSLPGETLYPIKRLVESAHSAIPMSGSAKGTLHLTHASTRLAEATSLAQAGDTERAAETLDDFVAQATQGATALTEAGQGEPIHDFAIASVSDLDLLSTLLPSGVISPVLQTLVGIDNAATQSLPDAGEGITSLPNSLVHMLASTLTPPGTSPVPPPTSVLAPTPSALTSPNATPKAATPTSAAAPRTPKAPSSPRPSATARGAGGGAVDELGDAVGNGVVGGLGGALSSTGASVGGPVGGLVGGVGDAVTGVGGLVNDLVDGVGSLLTPPSSGPQP